MRKWVYLLFLPFIIMGQEVTSTLPLQNALNVPISTPIQATFDAQLDTATIDSSSFVVYGSYGGIYRGFYSYDSVSRVVVFNGNIPFRVGEVITSDVTRYILTAGGDTVTPFIWQFTIGVDGGSGVFYLDRNYAAGNGPHGITTADLDGDGDVDLAVANYNSNNVSILINNGDGTFSNAVNYGAGSGPRGITSTDLDGDGDMDLAVTNDNSDNVSILLNNGDGTFGNAVNYAAGDGPLGITASDLDGDGDMDLAVANFWNDSVSILLNNGDGTFGSAVNYGAGDGPFCITASDFDGDGDVDLAVANVNSDNVSILLNNGDGTFGNAVNYVAGDGSRGITSTDLDGDGDMDLAVANCYSDNVSILLNNGDGTFGSAGNYVAGDGPFCIIASDLDGDGDMDLAVTNDNSDNVSILFNNGDGTFGNAVNYVAGDGSRGITSTDLDGDGDMDLAVANYNSDNVSILFNRDSEASISISDSSHDFGIVSTDDTLSWSFWIYNSGIDSVLIIDSIITHNSAYMVSPINGSVNPGDSIEVFVRFYTEDVGSFKDSIGIYSNASNDSVVYVFVSGRKDIYPGMNALGVVCSTEVKYAFGEEINSSTIDSSSFVVYGSYGGIYRGIYSYDSVSRVVVFNGNTPFKVGEVITSDVTRKILNSIGDPIFPFLWQFTIGVDGGTGVFYLDRNYGAGDGPNAITTTDLDGDGDMDLAVVNGFSDNVSILLNNGDGTFANPVNYSVGYGPEAITTTDFDGDGDMDLAVANYNSDNVSILLNNGDGTFGNAVNYGVGDDPRGITSADLDGDGDMDLAVANIYSDNVSILLNNGDGTFGNAVNYGVGYAPWRITSSDLDCDGDIDLTVAHFSGDYVSILLNNGDGTFGVRVNYGVGNYPKGITTTDLDGDGDMDLAVANEYSDNVSILLNNGDGTFINAVNYGAGDYPEAITTSDFDGDGDMDLAVANIISDNVSILFNRDLEPLISLSDSLYDFGRIEEDSVRIGSLWVFNLGGRDTLYIDSLKWKEGIFNASVSTYDVPGADSVLLTIEFSPVDAKEYRDTIYIYSNTSDSIVKKVSVRGEGGYKIRSIGRIEPYSNVVDVYFNSAIGTVGDTGGIVINGDKMGNRNITQITYSDSIIRVRVDKKFRPNERVNIRIDTSLVSYWGINLERRYVEMQNIGSLLGKGEYTLDTIISGAGSPYDICFGDLDSDSIEDMVVCYTDSNSIKLFKGDVSGGFTFQARYNAGSYPQDVEMGDLDNDGDLDIVVVNNGSDNISVYINNVSFPFTRYDYSVGASPRACDLGDINGDGYIDVAVGNLTGNSVSILINDGSGGLSLFNTYAVGSWPVGVKFGDVDGDGYVDLVVANRDDRIVKIMRNDVDSFVMWDSCSTGGRPSGLIVFDLDDDGDVDIGVSELDSVCVSLYRNSGGKFSFWSKVNVGFDGIGLEGGDVDGDGDYDLVVSGFYVDSVRILINHLDSFSVGGSFYSGDGVRNLDFVDRFGYGFLDLGMVDYLGKEIRLYKANAVGITLSSSEEVSGEVEIGYRLYLGDTGTANLECKYLVDSIWYDASVDSADVNGVLSGSGIIHWHSELDLPGKDVNVGFLTNAIKDTIILASDTLWLHVDNNHLQRVAISIGSGEVSDSVDIGYEITDSTWDQENLEFYWRVDSVWHEASIVGAVMGIDSSRYSGSVVWLSGMDIDSVDVESVYVRCEINDGWAYGRGDTIGPIHVDNNEPPVFTGFSITGEVGGEICVGIVSDMEGDSVGIVGRYSEDGVNWSGCDGLYIVGDSVYWNSIMDVDSVEVESLRLVVIPMDRDSGVSDTVVLDIDNNQVPLISLSADSGKNRGDIPIYYSINDRESDTIKVIWEYKKDTVWNRATVSESIFVDYNDTVIWHSDVDDSLLVGWVVFRATPFDNDTGTAGVCTLYVDQVDAPVVSIDSILGEQHDSVNVHFILSDDNSDTSGVIIEYSSDDGLTWNNASILGDTSNLATSPVGILHSIIWLSMNDLPGLDVESVLIKITPYDSHYGASVLSNPIHVDNNEPPVFTGFSITGEVGGEICVGIVSDMEGDSVGIVGRYSEDGVNWSGCDGLYIVGDSVYWNSIMDVDSVEVESLRLVVIPMDRDSGVSDTVVMHVDNNHLQRVVISIGSGEVSDSVDIGYEITDSTWDQENLEFYWRVDSVWHEASIVGAVVGIDSSRYSGSVVWLSRVDMGNVDVESVYVRCEINDGWVYGRGDTIGPIHVDNNEPPAILIDAMDTSIVYSGNIDIPVIITDREKDSVRCELRYTFGQSGSWTIGSITPEVLLPGTTSFTWKTGGFLWGKKDSVRIFIRVMDSDSGGVDSLSFLKIRNYAGDYNFDRKIDFADLDTFRYAWINQLPVLNIGPATGEIPNLTPINDRKINFSDLEVFGEMWDWYHMNMKIPSFTYSKSEEMEVIGIEAALMNIGDERDSSGLIKINCKETMEGLEGFGMWMLVDSSTFRVDSIRPGNIWNGGEKIFMKYINKNYVEAGIVSLNREGLLVEEGEMLLTIYGKVLKESIGVGYRYEMAGVDFVNANGEGYGYVKPKRIPDVFRVYSFHQNVVSGSVELRIDLPEGKKVDISVYDIMGRCVERITGGFNPGVIRLNLMKGYGSGIYFVRIQVGDYSELRRVVRFK